MRGPMSSNKTTTLAAVLTFCACGCVGVSVHDASELATGAKAIVAADPSLSLRLLISSCGEISSCASGCEKALRLAGSLDDSSQQAVVIAACFPDFRKQHEQS